MDISSKQINTIVEEVVKKIITSDPNLLKNRVCNTVVNTPLPTSSAPGIFNTIDDAYKAAKIAQKQLMEISLEKRGELIKVMRETLIRNADLLSQIAVEETGMGRVNDKVTKQLLVANKTPGIEDIQPISYTGDAGLTLVERAPYGVIGSITPSTNPSATVFCNSIGMIAAGNSVVFNPHPAAKKVSLKSVELINQAIINVGGPANLATTVASPSIQTSNDLMAHPEIRLLVVTGGPGIVKAAFASGKKVIAAGPGNPPAVVDETADLAKAAKNIVAGASFDNNILCIAEKEIIAVNSIADALLAELQKNGAYLVNSSQIDQLKRIVINEKGMPSRKYVGKNARIILKDIGVNVGDNIRLIIGETRADHPFVIEELLMPIVPFVRVADVDEAIELAYRVEGNCFHSSVMHSKNVESLHKMAKKMNGSIFVKNGPSFAGLSVGGEGPTTMSIATSTGEGITTARTFTKQRRCVLVDYFRIV